MAKGKYEYWRSKEGLLKLSAYARDGLSDEQIAIKLGISRSTLSEWKKKYPDISDTIKKDKEIPDIKVENALYKAALGYNAPILKAIKVKRTEYKNGKKAKEYEEIVIAEETIHVPANVKAQIFWLKNRKPDVWKDRQEVDNSVALERLDEVLKEIGGVI